MAAYEKLSDTTYRLTVSCGYNTKGRQIRKRKTIDLSDIPEKKREEEVMRQWYVFKTEVESGTFIDASKITFAEFIDRWLKDYARVQLEPKSLYGYEVMIYQRIIPALGHIKLDKLQPTHLMEFYNNLTETGIRMDSKCKPKEHVFEKMKGTGMSIKEMSENAGVSDKVIDRIRLRKNINRASAINICDAFKMKFDEAFDVVSKEGGLSDRTRKHHHSLISSILEKAVKWQVIKDNPASRATPPKVAKKAVNYYNEEQTKALLEALEEEPIKYRTMAILDVFTGLRTGEFMGLEWDDVDFENGTIRIMRASQYVNGKGTFTKDPKNETSVRMISIPDVVMILLKKYKAWQNEQQLNCGSLWKNSNRLFTSWDGAPEFTYALTNWFPGFLERHNLPKITPHGLRHTSATLLAFMGLDATSISKRLGHARTSTTMDIYAHALKKADHAASNMLQNLLVPSNEKKEAK